MSEEINIKNRKDEDEKILVAVCSYINANYDAINKELYALENLLKNIERCAEGYVKSKESLKSYINYCIEKKELVYLLNVVNLLKKVKSDSKTEIFQNIDFANIMHEVNLKIDDYRVIPFIWDANKVIQDIIYQFNRINTAHNTDKEVAILKGMIAYTS